MEVIGRSFETYEGLFYKDIELICARSDLEELVDEMLVKEIQEWEYLIEVHDLNPNIKFIAPKTLTNAEYETWRTSLIIAESAYGIIENNEEVQKSLLPACTAVKVQLKVSVGDFDFVKDILTRLVEG